MSSTILVLTEMKPDGRTITSLQELRMALNSLDWNVVVASNSDNAYDLLRQKKIDGVIATLSVFKNQSIFEFIEIARSKNVLDVPIIVVLAMTHPICDDILKIACEMAGAGYIDMGKLATAEALEQKLKSFLHSASLG